MSQFKASQRSAAAAPSSTKHGHASDFHSCCLQASILARLLVADAIFLPLVAWAASAPVLGTYLACRLVITFALCLSGFGSFSGVSFDAAVTEITYRLAALLDASVATPDPPESDFGASLRSLHDQWSAQYRPPLAFVGAICEAFAALKLPSSRLLLCALVFPLCSAVLAIRPAFWIVVVWSSVYYMALSLIYQCIVLPWCSELLGCALQIWLCCAAALTITGCVGEFLGAVYCGKIKREVASTWITRGMFLEVWVTVALREIERAVGFLYPSHSDGQFAFKRELKLT